MLICRKSHWEDENGFGYFRLRQDNSKIAFITNEEIPGRDRNLRIDYEKDWHDLAKTVREKLTPMREWMLEHIGVCQIVVGVYVMPQGRYRSPDRDFLIVVPPEFKFEFKIKWMA